MPQLEVLVGELVAVDGLEELSTCVVREAKGIPCHQCRCGLVRTWSALRNVYYTPVHSLVNCSLSACTPAAGLCTHVTALEHEVRDDTVEARAGVAKALLAGAERAEVGGGLGDDVIVELEDDAAGRLLVDGDVKVCLRHFERS